MRWVRRGASVSVILASFGLALGGCAAPPPAPQDGPTAISDSPSTPPSTAAAADPYIAPRLSQITIDGDDADWQDQGLRLDVLSPATPGTRNASGGDASVRMGWDARGWIVSALIYEEPSQKTPRWKGVEILLATDDVSRDMVHASLTPTTEKGAPVVRTGLRDSRQSKSLRQTKMSVHAAMARRADGAYSIEALLPWNQLAITPADGTRVNVQVVVNSTTADGERTKLIWYPVDGANFNRSRMYGVRLGEQPSRPVEVVAGGVYERFARLRVEVAAPSRYAGQTVAVRDGTRPIGQAAMASSGRLATANLVLPVPRIGETYRDLAIYAGAQRLAGVHVEDLDRARRRAFDESFFVFNSFVFTGNTFPRPEFDNPSMVDDVAGVCRIKTTYYDAEFRPVARPARPGRYGAIVEATSEQGWTIKRYYTLFRHDKPLPRDNVLSGAIELPREFGVDPVVGREQVSAVGEGLSRAMRASMSKNHDMAIILAGLAEMPAGTGPAPKRLGVWERNGQWWYSLRKSLGDITPYPYVARAPEGPAPANRKWPVLIFLHGLGERGNDLKRVAVSGPLKEIASGRSLPFLVIAPQCPGDEWWGSQKLSEMLDDVMARYPVDPDRIYLTGLSMGGFGTWAWAFAEPDRFAAIAPICGGGDPLDAQRILNLPVWVFHGGKDPTVRVEESYDMVRALRDLHGRVRFTLYPRVGHDSWTETYGNPALYEWLLQQRRGQPAEPQSVAPGTQPTFVVD